MGLGGRARPNFYRERPGQGTTLSWMPRGPSILLGCRHWRFKTLANKNQMWSETKESKARLSAIAQRYCLTAFWPPHPRARKEGSAHPREGCLSALAHGAFQPSVFAERNSNTHTCSCSHFLPVPLINTSCKHQVAGFFYLKKGPSEPSCLCARSQSLIHCIVIHCVRCCPC